MSAACGPSAETPCQETQRNGPVAFAHLLLALLRGGYGRAPTQGRFLGTGGRPGLRRCCRALTVVTSDRCGAIA